MNNFEYSDVNAVVRELQLKVNQLSSQVVSLETQLQNTNQIVQSQTPPVSTSPITQLLRNTDHSHSVNTWHETTPSGGNKDKECMYVFTHPADPAVTVHDGEMLAASNVLKCLTSTPFVSGDAAKRIIVEGAGIAGADLVTTIAGFTNSGEVTLTDPCVTAVSGAKVRFRLQKLGRTNSKNSGSATNDALKDASHSNYATNINDPDWDKTTGVVRLGSTNTLAYFFGSYDNATGAVFTPQNPLYPGRELYVIMNIARAHSRVKIPGRLFTGIYNNSDNQLQYLQGGSFTISGVVSNPPAATATTQYLIVGETDRGYTFVSEILTVNNAPSLSSYIPGVVEVALSWNPIPGGGDLRFKVYRKIDAGNVFYLEQIPNGSSRYIDNNPATRVDTGVTTFPDVTGLTGVISYVATRTNELANVPVGQWFPRQFIVPVTPSTSFSGGGELVTLIGLTEPLSMLVTDGVTDGSRVVTSASADFNEDSHDAKTVIIKDPADSTRVFTDTVDTVSNSNTIELVNPVPWSSEGNIIEILDGEPRGLIIDLVGASTNTGVWAKHPEDYSTDRGQNVATNPDGSVYGGITGGGGYDGGDTGPPNTRFDYTYNQY